MDMINVPVTLIVKAPNQQIEDQTIKCEPGWSIRKLKGYLAEVYPSKPRTEDQKLIYSGQLLSDTVILKDVLRKYDGQETHTVHLVCSSSRESLGQRSSPVGSRPSARMNETRRDSTTTVPRGEESQTSANVEMSNDGLRQRLSTANIPTSTTPQCNIAASGSVSGPGPLPTTDPRAMWAAAMAQPYPAPVYDPNNLAQQLMYMQQAYMQYMSQYMQMLAANAAQQSMTGPQPTLHVPEQPPVNNQPEPPGEDVANGPGGDDEEGRGNRDWLDWFYIMSRVMVLFSIVYFYSSPTRFVLVSALGMLMYLYQVGFFRAQQLQPVHVEAENNNHAADARLVDNNNLQNNQEEEAAVSDQEEESAAETEETDNETAEVQEERPSLLALTWTFFSTFFASLIPEQPEV